jgi:hypothetical protein
VEEFGMRTENLERQLLTSLRIERIAKAARAPSIAAIVL